MPVVTSDLLDLVLAGIKTEFDGAYIERKPQLQWGKFVTEIPTTLHTQTYDYMGRGPVMEEFVDEVEDQAVTTSGYTLQDKTYKGAMRIQRKSLEDDQYGLLMTRARELGDEAARHWDELAFTGLQNGFTNLCADKTPFFGTHANGQSNRGTDVLSADSLQAAITLMSRYVDDKGKPLGIKPDTLIISPELKWEAMTLLNSAFYPDPVTTASQYLANNVLQGSLGLIVSPYLTSPSDWYLADTSRVVKPLIMQNRSDVPITLESDMDMPDAHIREFYRVTVRGRYAQGYSVWQTAFGAQVG